ncbi:cytochrome b/b6 domain-containing protein [Methylobacterium organophilum]|nr:cytochrome b/b6 domain-containing protein [Methylobacterium organophilum]
MVADHLSRMAGDEPLNIAWQTESGAEPAAQPAENRALDSRTRYGTVSRVFHWLMALLIVWQFLKLGDRIAEGEHWVGQTLVPWHVSMGAVLLVLVVLRILWSASQLSRRPLHDPATAWLVKGGHLALYGCMVAMPVTGVLYLVGNGYGLKVFGQQLVEKGPEIAWAASVGGLHSPLAWLTVLLVIGHIGAALYHQLVKRDDIMQRML